MSLQFVDTSHGMLVRGSTHTWIVEIFRLVADMSFTRETRRAKRKAFDYVALLDFCDGEEPRPCEVRDISAGGARLAVFCGTDAVPEVFELVLSHSAKVKRACKVAWRSPTELGVQFMKPE